MPHAPMRAVFCDDCGTLIDPPESESTEVHCSSCMCVIDHAEFLHRVVRSEHVTHLRTDLDAGDGAAPQSKNAERALVNEQCEQCKNPEMYYYTMQLRSADEGQTVFYECPRCQYKFSTNT
mmetsp:Transcript_22347/g.75240  ORF Transcript_22347/g.75240 Transcript_22347/m.75240 type:complete len:121 (-) Transcript_22347:338-700(-)